MDERIKEHLQRLNRYYLQLVDLSKLQKEDFISDDIKYAAAERVLQIAIETCLNIGNRLISLLQFEQPVKAPESHEDIFVIMRDLNIIDSEFSNRLVNMAKFRNRPRYQSFEISALNFKPISKLSCESCLSNDYDT